MKMMLSLYAVTTVCLFVLSTAVISVSSFIQITTTPSSSRAIPTSATTITNNKQVWGIINTQSQTRQPQYNCNRNMKKNTNKLVLNIFDKLFEEEGPLGKGITVGRVQVALTAINRNKDSIFGLLDDASRSSDDSSEGLSEMCHELCLSLIRKQDDWIAACSNSRWFSLNDAGKAESYYNELSIGEATKFEKEYLAQSSSEAGGSTVVVVSLIIEIEGDTTVFEKAGYSRSETQKVLTSIASNVLVDDGQVVNAFEAFWTPGDGKEVLTTRDIIADFPELVTL